MSKKIEGRIFSPQEFRKLKQCITCGKASNNKRHQKCGECKAKNFKKCERCEIVLRNGLQKYYSYDIRENRSDEVRLKVSVESVIEFITEEMPYYPQATETLCSGCVESDKHWQERIKNRCYICDMDFENTKENYQLNGNMCDNCKALYYY